MRTKLPRVALLIETSNAYARGLLEGINTYILEHGPWSAYLGEQRRGERVPSWLPSWRGDGVLARIENRHIADALLKTRLPTVNLSKTNYTPAFPCVETDDAAFARAAIEHLLERGFRHFAFCGVRGFRWSTGREEHFLRLVEEAGFDGHRYEEPSGLSGFEAEQQHLTQWVRKLPKPIGLMAAYDIRGRQVLDACRRADVPVPDQVAVIAVDNDDLLCGLSHPPLSSVIPNTHKTGYEAAALLDRMMSGEKVPAEEVLIEPLGVSTRQSTDVMAISDRDVSEAMRFIRNHACEGIKVADIVQHVPLSRRALEHRFQKLIGRSPHAEIARLQLERAQVLLADTDLPLRAVAHKCGFKHVEYLSTVFKRRTGMTPGEYRKVAGKRRM